MAKQTKQTDNKPANVIPPVKNSIPPVELTPPVEVAPPVESPAPPAKDTKPEKPKKVESKHRDIALEIMKKHNIKEVYCVNGYFFTKKENASNALRQYPESKLETFNP